MSAAKRRPPKIAAFGAAIETGEVEGGFKEKDTELAPGAWFICAEHRDGRYS